METLEGVLAEIRGLTDQLGLPFKEDVLIALCNVRDNIIQRNNILEIKEAYARRNLKDSHVCRFVEESNIYIIIPSCWIKEDTTIEIEEDTMTLYTKGCAPYQTSFYGTISGVTEQLAWINACNKILIN